MDVNILPRPVDHFFRTCEEMRVTVPDTMKYFCMSEAIAFYLQNYIVYRKRKIFVGKLHRPRPKYPAKVSADARVPSA